MSAYVMCSETRMAKAGSERHTVAPALGRKDGSHHATTDATGSEFGSDDAGHGVVTSDTDTLHGKDSSKEMLERADLP